VGDFPFLLRAVAFFISLKIKAVRPLIGFYTVTVALSLALLKLGEGILSILKFSLKRLFFLGVKGSTLVSPALRPNRVTSFYSYGAVVSPGATGLVIL
jgi:hypothetical protein